MNIIFNVYNIYHEMKRPLEEIVLLIYTSDLDLVFSYFSSTHGVTQSLIIANKDTNSPTMLRLIMLIKCLQNSSKSSQLLTRLSTERKESRILAV